MVYRSPKKLHVRGSAGMVAAERGVEQGDPWGPFLFALGLAETVEELLRTLDESPEKRYLAVALLDDITVAAPLGELARVCPLLQ